MSIAAGAKIVAQGGIEERGKKRKEGREERREEEKEGGSGVRGRRPRRPFFKCVFTLFPGLVWRFACRFWHLLTEIFLLVKFRPDRVPSDGVRNFEGQGASWPCGILSRDFLIGQPSS